MTTVTLGLDRLIASGRLRGRGVGLVTNPASVDASFRSAPDRLEDAGVRPVALFGPQHGFRSDVQDDMIETPHAHDHRRGVPIYSLYSETRIPTAEMLRGIDVLVVDLQDVGTRVYTYVYTMANCLRAAAAHGIDAIVCDRPNPIGGAVEGPVLDPAYSSFVGQFPIPLRHGMTVGELASLFNETFGLGARLDVVAMEGWSRDLYHDATGLPWVMPSPNVPTLDSAIVFPGCVLLEGTNVSEGRGTTRPFELVSAPWVDADRLVSELAALHLPGVHFRPVAVEPTFHKHAGTTCGGCQIHVLDRLAFRPVHTAVALILAMRAQAPSEFVWRDPPYEYEREKRPIDVLYGSGGLRAAVDAGHDAATIAQGWEAGCAAFEETRRPHLLY